MFRRNRFRRLRNLFPVSGHSRTHRIAAYNAALAGGRHWLVEEVGEPRVFGRANPAAISQINPGKRVNGISGKAFGTIRNSQLNSPTAASARPKKMSHLGRSFMKNEVTHTPAINR